MGLALPVTEISRPRSFRMDYKRRRSYTRSFRVVMDDPVYDGLAAAVHVGINYQDIYRTQASANDGSFVYDSGAIAVEVDGHPETDDDYRIWIVNWRYESHLDQQGDPALWTSNPTAAASTAGGGGANETPTLEPAKYYWGKRERKVASRKPIPDPSNSFDKYRNSAGTPFKAHPEVDGGIRTLVITKNLILPNAPDAFRFYDEFQDTVNADPFFGYLPEQVKCESIVGNSAYRNKVTYHEMTFNFAISGWGWKWEPVDKGPMYFPTGEFEIQKAVERTGHPNEVFLDGSGEILAGGADPFLLTFKVYESKEFWPLGLE